jgi:hypothetical protein
MLNYDLLLNWVSLSDAANLTDGFGLGERRMGFQGPFKLNAYCKVYISTAVYISFATPAVLIPAARDAPAPKNHMICAVRIWNSRRKDENFNL